MEDLAETEPVMKEGSKIREDVGTGVHTEGTGWVCMGTRRQAGVAGARGARQKGPEVRLVGEWGVDQVEPHRPP